MLTMTSREAIRCRSLSIHAVWHLAAQSPVDRSIQSGLRFVTTNVVGTQMLLEAARRHHVQRFIHVSTDEVYGSVEPPQRIPASSIP